VEEPNKERRESVMRVVIVDPGGTTGWAVMDYDFDMDVPPVLATCGQEPGDRFPALLREVLTDPVMHIDLVVYERFRIYKGTIGDSAVPVLKQIGRIELVCEELGIPYREHPPAHKTFFEKRLASFGMHEVGAEHARDAIAHGLYFFMTEAKKRNKRSPSWILNILPRSSVQ
jgi:hypothetical protein